MKRNNRGRSVRVDDEFFDFLEDFRAGLSRELDIPISQREGSRKLMEKLRQRKDL